MPCSSQRRILIIDDQDAIHEDYRKIICPKQLPSASLDAVEAELFGGSTDRPDLFDSATDETDDWNQYEIDSAYQGHEGLKLVEQSLRDGRPYAVAFVDIRMPPGWDGIQTVRQIWEVDPEILVVLCSAHSDYSWQDIVGQLGRTDRFLILKKPFDNVEVRQCAAALTERWLVARTDPLTGVLNRRAFDEHLRREWAYSLRHNRALACVMFDLDFFHVVNDTCGHSVGDEALQSFAKFLQHHAPQESAVGRLGGDKFCVMISGSDEADAAVWAESVRERFAREPLGSEPPCHGATRLTISGGVAVLSAATVRQDGLLEHAEAALRCAKNAGRNRIYCWSEQDHADDRLQRIQQYATRFAGLTAADMMSRSVAPIEQTITVGEAAMVFLKGRFSTAPVIDSAGELVGMLSEKDIIEAWGAEDGWSRTVQQVMTPRVIQYEPDTPADEIFRFLCRVQLRRVVITEQRRPVGTIACSNFLEWFCDAGGEAELACCSAD